ncbi:MAG: chromate transporter [Acetobacteraceae bacterium]|nr:chromate transporter [Acetobacteraceae bacterium]
MDAEAPAAAVRLTPLQLFTAFARIGLSAFGQLIPVGRHALVEKHKWLSDAEFAEMLAIGQMLPGPNMVNLSASLGDRNAGWAGAAAAVSGLVIPPTIVAIAIAATLYRFSHDAHVSGALSGMAAAACGLVLATALKLARNTIRRAHGVVLALAIFAAVALLRLPLAVVLVVALPLSLWVHGALRRIL